MSLKARIKKLDKKRFQRIVTQNQITEYDIDKLKEEKEKLEKKLEFINQLIKEYK